MNLDKTKEWVIETAKKENVKFIRAQFVDVNGALKSTAIPANLLPEILDEGIGFDGSSVEGYTPIYESDMILMPDPTTFAIIPWRSSEYGKVARLICDVYWGNKKRFEGDPRYVAQRVSENAKKEGYIFNCGPELEFFLFKEENGKFVPLDHGRYFDFHPLDLAENFRRDVIKAMTENFGMEVEMSHHEVAPGQYEIDVKYDELVRMADKVITYKMVTKSIANAYGLIASFMPKPIFGENGSGMHTHQSLWDIKKNKNAFFDESGGRRGDHLSDVALYFIGGLMKHARALSAIVAPTVNSYKRLVPGYEAPVYVTWAHKNRSALIRVPEYFPGNENATRVELRCPDPSCNPYLAFACMCAAGLDGIKNKILPPEPIEENIFELTPEKRKEKGIITLPSSLKEALDELENDEVLKNTLGKHIYENFMRFKNKEWDEYRTNVTEWEIERYLKKA